MGNGAGCFFVIKPVNLSRARRSQTSPVIASLVDGNSNSRDTFGWYKYRLSQNSTVALN